MDDEGDFIELVKFRLANLGCEFLVAGDGVHALSQAREGKPDLILLDIQLPLMDGYAVARALRGIESLRGTPIIAVTSYAMVGDRERALAAGCTGYIEKPINIETFVAEVARFAGESLMPREPM